MKKITLGKDQFVETERTYVVSILLHRVDMKTEELHNKLISFKFRATSKDQAIGMAVRAVRSDNNLTGWLIGNFNFMEI